MYGAVQAIAVSHRLQSSKLFYGRWRAPLTQPCFGFEPDLAASSGSPGPGEASSAPQMRSLVPGGREARCTHVSVSIGLHLCSKAH